jgi:hypothetical protein
VLAITEFPGVERLVISGIRASASFVDRHQSERSSVYRASERADRIWTSLILISIQPTSVQIGGYTRRGWPGARRGA